MLFTDTVVSLVQNYTKFRITTYVITDGCNFWLEYYIIFHFDFPRFQFKIT